jgi:hypothetical protein
MRLAEKGFLFSINFSYLYGVRKIVSKTGTYATVRPDDRLAA